MSFIDPGDEFPTNPIASDREINMANVTSNAVTGFPTNPIASDQEPVYDT